MVGEGKVNHWDRTTKTVLGFLVAKGFIVAPTITPKPTAKIDIKAAIKVGTQVEPRVLEVLPAAMLRFPKSFLHWENIPEKLRVVLECLKKNLDEGPDLGGLPYKDLKQWADFELPDKRTVPNNEKKVKKYWKLRPAIIAEIKRRADIQGISEGQVIEALLNAEESVA